MRTTTLDFWFQLRPNYGFMLTYAHFWIWCSMYYNAPYVQFLSKILPLWLLLGLEVGGLIGYNRALKSRGGQACLRNCDGFASDVSPDPASWDTEQDPRKSDPWRLCRYLGQCRVASQKTRSLTGSFPAASALFWLACIPGSASAACNNLANTKLLSSRQAFSEQHLSAHSTYLLTAWHPIKVFTELWWRLCFHLHGQEVGLWRWVASRRSLYMSLPESVPRLSLLISWHLLTQSTAWQKICKGISIAYSPTGVSHTIAKSIWGASAAEQTEVFDRFVDLKQKELATVIVSVSILLYLMIQSEVLGIELTEV